ncbi:MAG: hypothetical protein IPK16_30050 [Anaerolineales bacterium]|nr:hypothetical protein [Anaerolineales bacterium]
MKDLQKSGEAGAIHIEAVKEVLADAIGVAAGAVDALSGQWVANDRHK